jgi:hypothetical protein
MADFWGMLGKSIPKKGYSKYGKSIDRKVSRVSKSAAKKRKANVARLKKEKAQKIAPKRAKTPKEKPLKWRPYKTFKDREIAFREARLLREHDNYQTRVDGTARGYQVWIKS